MDIIVLSHIHVFATKMIQLSRHQTHLHRPEDFEFPQGDNSWDNDAMKIYQDFP